MLCEITSEGLFMTLLVNSFIMLSLWYTQHVGSMQMHTHCQDPVRMRAGKHNAQLWFIA